MPELGRLERVSLREIWRSESSDFTPWLAGAENMKLLAETLRLELELEGQEERVGQFRADILCRDTASGAWVLIENQLERTDHAHLGQLLTYAAGLEAVVLVWIAERFTEEHRAALDWLNELGNEKLRCFGLEIELWRIGQSPVAPKFNVVSEPNDWARTITATAGQIAAGSLSPTRQLQVEYWSEFARMLRESGSILRPQKPLPQNWMNLALGRSGVHLAAIASTFSVEKGSFGAGELRAEVIADHPQHSKAIYAALERDRAQVEASLKEPLNWVNSAENRVGRIFHRREADIRERERWPEQHAWLKAQLEALHREFAPRCKAITLSAG